MYKRLLALIMIFALVVSFAGCNEQSSQYSSDDIEVIIEEEEIRIEDNTSSNESVVSSDASEQVTSEDDTTDSSEESTPASQPSSNTEEDTMVNIDYDWKKNSQDYKLIAFTFDDGPGDLMQQYVQYFQAFEGAGTFFVNGYKITNDYAYEKMQNAINYGWDIGNHGDQHLVATIGGTGGSPVTYDALRADIDNLTQKLESKLKFRDGSPYEVSCYRPPNIKPTENTFKICDEEKFPVIWLKYDALDWDTTKTYEDRYKVFKDGIGTWEDGDIILCHEVQQYAEETYKILEELLPDFYRAGYRFCSISELMKLRGITRDQICGELNEVDGNRGMVTNIVKAAKQGKK